MQDTEQTSRYANDPRVEVCPGGSSTGAPGYIVRAEETGPRGGKKTRTFHVLDSGVFAWVICEGPNLDFVPTTDGGFAINISSADGAIEALIGEPLEA